MARVTAPLFSIDASGTFANQINAASLRGRAYMRKRANNRQTWTQAQRSHYLRLAFLRNAWQTAEDLMPGVAHPLWEPIADELKLPPYQAFIKTNYARWTTTASPIIAPGQGGAAATGIFMLSPTTGKGFISLNILWTFDANLFGAHIVCKTGANAPLNLLDSGMILAHPLNHQVNNRQMITHLAPGTYRVTLRRLNTNGTYSVPIAGFVGLVVT